MSAVAPSTLPRSRRRRVLAQHAHQIAGPGPVVEEDVAVEPGNVAATAGQPGSGQVEQTLLLPEQRTGADLNDVQARRQFEGLVAESAFDGNAGHPGLAHAGDEQVVVVPPGDVATRVEVGGDDNKSIHRLKAPPFKSLSITQESPK